MTADPAAERDRLAAIKADLEARALAVDPHSREAREHYVLAMVVAQCAWNYVNPPDDHTSQAERRALLQRAVHDLRRYELRMRPEGTAVADWRPWLTHPLARES